MKTIAFFLIYFSSIVGLLEVCAQTETPDPRVTIKLSSENAVIYMPFVIEWECVDHGSTFPQYQLEYRHKLDVPGDWRGGIKYNINKWSEWTEGDKGSYEYNEFIIEGKYTVSVQCRNIYTKRKSKIHSRSFNIFWEYPEVQEEAFNIDWNKVEMASSKQEKYKILSEEYKKAHLLWNKEFDYQLRLLKLTTSPEEIIASLSTTIAEEGLIHLASKQTAKVVSKILLQKTIYEVIKQGVVDLILINRNNQANRASAMAVVSYCGWKYFEKMANEVRFESVNTIYYISDQTGNRNLFRGYLVNDKVVDQKQITSYSKENEVIGYNVCMNTRRIAIVVSKDGRNGDIFILENEDSEPMLLPNQPAEKSGAQVYWSYDDDEIIFSKGAPRHNNDLVVAKINIDGSSYLEFIATKTPMNTACHKSTINLEADGMYIGITPQWSSYATKHELWFRSNNNTFKNITSTNTIGERHGYLSPNGRYLVFQTLDNNYAQGLRYMPKDGGEQTTIIAHSKKNRIFPNGWMDDNTIIFSYKPSDNSRNFDLYLINLDGTMMRNISNTINANITHAQIVKEPTSGNTSIIHSAKEPMIDLEWHHRGNDNSVIKLIDRQSSLNLEKSSASVEIFSSSGMKHDFSSNYRNGEIDFYPFSGAGKYTIILSLQVSRLAGGVVQENISKELDINELPENYVGLVERSMGSLLFIKPTEGCRVYPGMMVRAVRFNPLKTSDVAAGRITFVGDQEITIEVDQSFSEVQKGDLITMK